MNIFLMVDLNCAMNAIQHDNDYVQTKDYRRYIWTTATYN